MALQQRSLNVAAFSVETPRRHLWSYYYHFHQLEIQSGLHPFTSKEQAHKLIES